MKILPIIMCGGSGTRMWPESRESLPKQFIPLFGARSTFQLTLENIDDPLFEAPIVISNQDYRFLVSEQVQETGRAARVVLEPTRRDSAPAVAVGAELAMEIGPDTIVAIFAADHVVRDRAAFIACCRAAAQAASAGYIVTLGIKPAYAATGYGYIKTGSAVLTDCSVVKTEVFVEKPNSETASVYLAEGYLWNAGDFVFRADIMRGELRRHAPLVLSAAAEALAKARTDLEFLILDKDAFSRAPKISIDYAVMECTDKGAVVPSEIGWSDVGTWAAVDELSRHDSQGNAIRGNGVVLDAQNVHIRSDDHLTTVVGVDNVIVITTQDAVLVLDRAHGDDVKRLVDTLKSQNRREALEHKRSYRPWGYYQSIDNGPRYQVKRIVVKPGARLSLQKHCHRAEHWIVVRGVAEVTRNSDVLQVHENESVFLPIGSVHRLANPGKIDLELIEVQTGSYLGEDDIVRLEDVYNRV